MYETIRQIQTEEKEKEDGNTIIELEKKLDNTEAETRNLQGQLEQIQLEKEKDIEKLKLELFQFKVKLDIECDQNTENFKAKGKYVSS